MSNYNILHGDVVQHLKTFQSNTFHALLTDPPYGVFNRSDISTDTSWKDSSVPSTFLFKHIHRVMRPGAYGFVFAAQRTFHRMLCNIEDAGFEIIDVVMYVYSTGMPLQSYVLSKNIDKHLGYNTRHGINSTSPEAKKYYDYATTLKPMYEPIALIRKPYENGTVKTVLKHNTGALNVHNCRIGNDVIKGGTGVSGTSGTKGLSRVREYETKDQTGRYPGNVIVDDDVSAMLSKELQRFFYCAKPSKEERKSYNIHPTVKPLTLTEYLAKMLKLPTTSTKLLVPYSGSGTEIIGALKSGWNDITGIELSKDFIDISHRRIKDFGLC